MVQAFRLAGGLDLVSPTTSIAPGVARESVNFEVEITGGYRRIAGYQRFDGRPAPNSAEYVIIYAGTTVGVSLGDTLSNQAGAEGVVIYLADDLIVITRRDGLFAAGDTLSVGATEIGTATLVLDENPPPSACAPWLLDSFIETNGTSPLAPHTLDVSPVGFESWKTAAAAPTEYGIITGNALTVDTGGGDDRAIIQNYNPGETEVALAKPFLVMLDVDLGTTGSYFKIRLAYAGGYNSDVTLQAYVNGDVWVRVYGEASLFYTTSLPYPNVGAGQHKVGVWVGTTSTEVLVDGVSVDSAGVADIRELVPYVVVDMFPDVFVPCNGALNEVAVYQGCTLGEAMALTRRIDPDFANVVFLLGCEGASAADESSYLAAVANGPNAPVCSTDQNKFSGRSLKLTGNASECFCYVEHAGLADVGTKAYTMEGWFYIDSSSSNYVELQSLCASDGTKYSESGYAGTSRYAYGNTETFGDQYLGVNDTPDTILPLDQWFHLAVVKAAGNNNPRTYVDGALKGTWAGTTDFTTQARATIGRFRSSADNIGTFYCEEVRVTLNVERYTGATYTVPTAVFPRG
jgi:hypothetical protein